MKLICLVLLYFLSLTLAYSQESAQSVFKLVPLGVKGGVDESNLSAYLVAANGTDDYICLDAGTIHAGIQKAIESGVFHQSAEAVLRQDIKAYFISHAHLDHVAGMIINSPDDSSKNIYGLPFCLDILKDKYFTWKNWANFTNEGDTPRLNKYHYVALDTSQEKPIPHTGFSVRAFTLSHSNPYQSTAFLVKVEDNYILYLGDTGSDEVEKSDRLLSLWMRVGPLITAKKLKAIMIEVSFPNEQPDKQLFGHLTPKWLMKEMRMLRQFTAPGSLIGFPLVITHIKPHGNNESLIKEQLKKENELKLKLVFPEQGKMLQF
jgi:cAMP phosphodiesterase